MFLILVVLGDNKKFITLYNKNFQIYGISYDHNYADENVPPQRKSVMAQTILLINELSLYILLTS